jgi:hypothetical protein
MPRGVSAFRRQPASIRPKRGSWFNSSDERGCQYQALVDCPRLPWQRQLDARLSCETDEIFKAAFEVFKTGYLANEFTGLPVAEDLMRSFDEQFQLYLDGSQSLDDALNNAQAAWVEKFQ